MAAGPTAALHDRPGHGAAARPLLRQVLHWLSVVQAPALGYNSSYAFMQQDDLTLLVTMQ